MDDFKAFILLGFLLFSCIGSFIAIFTHYRHARRIEDTPTSNVKSAAQGYVELTGRAAGFEGEQLRAPISESECLWYRYSVEKRKGILPPKYFEWDTIQSGTSRELFKLVDETGECVVMPETASVTGIPKNRWHGDTETGKGKAFLRGMYRYNEELIKQDMPLYTIGWFTTLSSVNVLPVMREPLQQLLDEWRKNRSDMLVSGVENGRVGKSVCHVVSSADDDNFPFMISSSHENEAASHYRKKSVGAAALFFISGILFIVVMQQHFRQWFS